MDELKDEDIIANAIKHREAAETGDRTNREMAADDLAQLTGQGQWADAVRTEREAEGKPCITINVLPQSVRQVTGQIRALNPAIKVSPADSLASKDTAEIMEGMIRQIEYCNDAASVYEATAESAAACGIGAFRIRSDYCPGETFDQEILIERVYNPFAVFFDPQAKHPTRRDGQFAFIIEDMERDAFKKAHPDADDMPFTSEHRPSELMQWSNTKTVTVAEYYWIEQEKSRIGLMSDGTVVRNPQPPLMFTKERTVMLPRVKWAKITGKEVLEGPLDIPGRFIPVIAVTGEEWHLGEESYRSGVIRHAKDAQLVYNVAVTANTEVTLLQPRAPYMITAAQVAGYEDEWSKANVTNASALVYNADPEAPPPMRVPPPLASQGLMAMMQVAAEDIKRTTGVHDAAMGAPSNETSGRAIEARKSEVQNSTSIYADNMVKAVMQAGRIIVDWIPEIYDTERVVRVLGEDDQEKLVTINSILQDQNGTQPVNDVKYGKYDVRISVGPSYSTKRQEASEGMLEFLRVVPQAQAVIPDLIAKSQDWPDSDRIAERLRKQLPPGIAEEDEDVDPQIKAAQDQAKQQAQAQEAEAMEIGKRKAIAETEEAEADARKAAAEADKARFEVMAMTGKVEEAINAMATQKVMQVVGGMPRP